MLSGLGLSFSAVDSDVSEFIAEDMPPDEVVKTLALRKAEAVKERLSGKNDIIIGADTVVVFENLILGKPVDNSDAFRMLTMLSGAWHDVYTGVAVLSKDKTAVNAERTRVKFSSLSAEEIEKYMDSGEPFDKAGGYGIQEKGATIVERLEGDYFNVVGLPLNLLRKMLLDFGIDLLA